ncbi:MAG: D-Ala-D-Ala carboxypeptidase family metallohydrolase, partial [Leptolyngbyaceae bacterium]|nr:D-Ala-D-Ala carboxypeptidase family metallohydrolase [Leptolyngbyaceae bacterium]
MADLAPDQRNYFYLLAAGRVGIHKSILYALRVVQAQPDLADGEKGLGIYPANQMGSAQIDTFPEQVQYAANTIRSLTNTLIEQGWTGEDFWDAKAGRYADKFLERIAAGYRPDAQDRISGNLAASDTKKLKQSYIIDLNLDYSGDQLPQSLGYLDRALLDFAERVPRYYQKLAHQREAFLEAVRIWRQLNTDEEAIASLLGQDAVLSSPEDMERLDREATRFATNMSTFYSGFPHQREAILRAVQLWRQLPSREDAIESLQADSSPESSLRNLDPALLAFVKRVPSYYQGRGDQRHALTECFRLWRGIASRKQALLELGIQQDIFTDALDTQTAQEVARQLDQALLEFARRVPFNYGETDAQRESLVRLIQLWRKLATRQATLQSVIEDLKQLEQAKPTTPVVVPPPALPRRPSRWTPHNIQIAASIIPNGNFTWAEATRGGQRMPPDQATVDAIVRIAKLAQQARNQIGRPFVITSWYRPPAINAAVGGATFSRHVVGDAIDYYVEGFTGRDLYNVLSPWWPGGLGLYGGSR